MTPECEKCGKIGIVFLGSKLLCADCFKKVETAFDNMVTEALI